MIIEARYNGPKDSGNGGWTAGSVAQLLGSEADAVTVTLRQPPPLETPLREEAGGDKISVYGPDGALVAEGTPAEPPANELDPISYLEAVEASVSYPGFVSHPFPTCFVCGPLRQHGDGLRLFPGRIMDGLTATPWRVPADVSARMVWASLDCPGGWSVGIESRPYVLGRITARVNRTPAPGADCVVVGRLLDTEGRKAHVATTLFGPDASVLAVARATWVATR
jgi:hypothetical protein